MSAGGSGEPAPAEEQGSAAGIADPIVQYLLLRADLKKQFSLGALVAQGAHASVAAIELHKDLPSTQAYLADLPSMRKVVLAAQSAAEVERVAAALAAAALGHRVWLEQPEAVVTALATAPYPRSVLASFFVGLKLLR